MSSETTVRGVIDALNAVAKDHGRSDLYGDGDAMPLDERLEKLFQLVAETKAELTTMQRRRLFVAFDRFLDELKDKGDKSYVLNGGEAVQLRVLPFEKLNVVIAHIGLTLHGSA